MKSKVLEINNLSISFGGLKAVDNLSFDIRENEIFGLIGPNGAGKTTVFNCITQFYQADEGTIMFTDRNGIEVDLNTVKVNDVIRRGLVRTFQNVEIVPEMTVLENVMVGGYIHHKTRLIQHIFHTKEVREEENKVRQRAIEVIEEVGIVDYMNFLAGSAPYGIRKKVELARALMSKPKLIILDEPAAGLNDIETDKFAKLICKIRDDYDCTVLLVEHDMRLVMEICDRICAISFGKFIAMGTAKEVQSNQEVITAYLGEDEANG